MDIRVKTMLDFIQSLPQYSNAVIAGGAVRDYHYDLEPKDYDIFVPVGDVKANINNLISRISKEFKLEAAIVDKGQVYASAKSLKGVSEIKWEGKIFDIIGKYETNDDQFGFKVIADFDFGNTMAFYNGLYVEDSNDHWKYDTRHNTMSLVNINSVNDLPGHIERYSLFKKKLLDAKGWNVRFAAPCLQVKKEAKAKVENPYAKKRAEPEDLVFNPEPRAPMPVRPWNNNDDLAAERARQAREIARQVDQVQRERDERGRFVGGNVEAGRGGPQPIAVEIVRELARARNAGIQPAPMPIWDGGGVAQPAREARMNIRGEWEDPAAAF